MTDLLRVRAHDLLLASTWGEHLRPIKLAREVLATANDLTGRPLCTQEELAARRGGTRVEAAAKKREAAPVMLYFDGRDHRTKTKMEELLRARAIPFQVLDVGEDESTRSWATTAARRDEFPILFIAGEPVGGLHELTQIDVNGELVRRVFG